jgi:hypothetical protein
MRALDDAIDDGGLASSQRRGAGQAWFPEIRLTVEIGRDWVVNNTEAFNQRGTFKESL